MFIHPIHVYRYKNLHHIQNSDSRSRQVHYAYYICVYFIERMIPLKHFQYFLKNLLNLHYNNKVIRAINGTFKLMLSFF